MNGATSHPATGSGAALDRLIEELTDRIQAGESIDPEAILEQHPEQADALRSLLPALEMLATLGRSAARGLPLGPLPGGELGILGDFRIVREVGRGGMGVVYEAEQLSLGRRVALKVLPFAAALDPRQLRRFQLEAQAAAQLHHTHIVPIFSVGTERGVHYYAMQFIDGRPLSALIAELRRLHRPGPAKDDPTESGGPSPERDAAPAPTAPLPATWPTGSAIAGRAFFEAAARLGIEAAEALEYAHSLGVVHRDVKPANLLIDARGQLWVTDFGLARCQAEAGLTLTGDLLGTMRYMSPEQALAKHGLVDHRTDVYALGATLYELLTLRPALDGRDRQELLRQLAFEEPALPRAINPAIPRELETIVLKAMAKEPADRYHAAQELADDLGRFLAHRPIHARRPGPAERAAKWARRHTTLVASGFTLMLLAVVGLTVGAALLARERSEADRHRVRAEANYRRALEAVDGMLTGASRSLIEIPQAEPVRKALLERALAFYREILRERGDDPAVRFETGRASRRVGEINKLLGRHADAEVAYDEAITLLDRLVREHPNDLRFRIELARAHYMRGNSLLASGQSQEAEPAFRRALVILDSPAGGSTSDEGASRLASQVRNNLGALLLNGNRLDEADRLFRENIGRVEAWSAKDPRDAEAQEILGNSSNNIGLIHTLRNQHELALPFLERALRHGQAAVMSAPDPGAEIYYRRDLADARENLALTLSYLGEKARAIEELRQLVALREIEARDFPRVPRHRDDLAQSLSNLAQLQAGAGEHQEADRAHRRALELFRALHDEQPANGTYRNLLAVCLTNLASFLADCPDERFRDPAQAVALAREATALKPDDRVAWRARGRAAYRAGNWDESIAALEGVGQAQAGGRPSDLYYLAMAHHQRGDASRARPLFEEASRVQRAGPESDLLRRLHDEAAALLGPPELPDDVFVRP